MKNLVLTLSLFCLVSLSFGAFSDCLSLLQELKKYDNVYNDFKECGNLIMHGMSDSQINISNYTVLGSQTLGKIKGLYEMYQQSQNNTSCMRLSKDLDGLKIPEDEYVNCFESDEEIEEEEEQQEVQQEEEAKELAAEFQQEQANEAQAQANMEKFQEEQEAAQQAAQQAANEENESTNDDIPEEPDFLPDGIL